MNFKDKSQSIPETMPMLPVRDMVFFPYMILTLIVGRDASKHSVQVADNGNKFLFLASQKDIMEDNPTPDSIYQVGTVVCLKRCRVLSDGRLKIMIEGVAKARIKNFVTTSPNFEVCIEKIEEPQVQGAWTEVEAMIRNVKSNLEKIIALGRPILPDILLLIDDLDKDPGKFADLVASHLQVKLHEAQKVLETLDPKERLKLVNEILAAELEVMMLQQKIHRQSNDERQKSQREYMLREQMKAIKNELGEGDSKSEEMEELREKIKNAGMAPTVETEALKQLGRLERMHPDASEATMVRTYLDWMVDLPWAKRSEDTIDLGRSREILDEDHYELQKAKDRILEFLAVRKLKTTLKGPILCFAGPPGVGKTSLGKSIARSMGREYFRIALGGVKDEAEIRGHRRTYVGAMPGKIISALRQVKTNNPVLVLDEIDKLGSDFRGDPSAAMLEVLDPEQNSTFRDNYLNVDFDLSNVLFIATANVVENIPPALRDRMEIINIPGYTENDKLLIAKKHLVARQTENNGITSENISFTDDGIKYIISGYTREAGLRNLEREVGSICRKVAKMIVMGETNFVQVTPQVVSDLLGPPRFMRDDKLSDSQIGVVQGLAWTQAGGEVLLVEALRMRGKGGLVLTGQLGDVMKESAQAAMSYAKAHLEELGIPEEFFDKNDVHIHLPAGAIPKDGPSAGITLATALVSLMTETPVRHDLAMTGEVTLQGRVLPVGGIREKCLAALNQGITDVLIPKANEKDLSDIPKLFKDKLNFVLVDNLEQVFSVAFDKSERGKRLAPKKDGKKNKSATAA